MTSGKDRAEQAKVQQKSDIASGMRITLVGAGWNILLALAKLWVGTLSRSQALIADGIHSLSDLLSDVVVLVGLRWGRKGEDQDHPWGHGRIESVASMMIGVLLLGVALGIAYDAATSIYEHNESSPGLPAVLVAILSILIKESLYQYTIRIGRRLKSLALIGNAWHHRTDALSSVAVLIGVGGAWINPEWRIADSLAAIVVSGFVAKVGGVLVWEALKQVVDTAPDANVLNQLTEHAGTVDGVRQIHDMRARYSGSQIFVEVHIVVDPTLTVREGHEIARKVKRRLLQSSAGVTRVIVHVDPELKMDNPKDRS